MKIGILGFPQCGKKTLFQLLTGIVPHVESRHMKPVPGTANIRDTRFDVLVELYNPRKQAPAQILMELLPDLDSRVMREEDIFKDTANLDAICHVVRVFKDDTIYHVSGSIDPARDIKEIENEFILHDLIFTEKRLERIAKNAKGGITDRQKREKALFKRFKEHLESDLPLRITDMSHEDMKLVNGYPFLTMKEMVVALNTSDNLPESEEVRDRLNGKYSELGINIIRISARLEGEIALLESREERSEFMEDAGIEESAINQLSKMCMNALGLISFFTVGKDEVRQWLVRRDSLAPEAGGVIHSDLERGFIRAEVIKYEDLIEFGSEDKVKQAGKLYVMGRDYQVADGDIINFLFNV